MEQKPSVPGFIYARQSKTRDGSESLDIQVDECRKAAERLGIDVVGEFVEPPSTSGYKNRGRNRAKFAEMLAAITTGEARAILVYKSERLSRGGGPGWAPVFDAIDTAGLNADRAVATPNGWMSEFEIGIRATMDREESKKLADRMSDVRAREARAGKPRGGGKRPFGYQRDLLTLCEPEAALIRQAAERVLCGESPFGIAQDWNRQGIPAPGGGHWAAQTLKRVLTSGRVAGMREHRGAVVAEAEWPAIIERQRWEKIRLVILGGGGRRSTPVRCRVRSFPLTGIARCGRCGSPLWGRTRNSGRREYTCSNAQTSTNKEACGSLVIHADAVEADMLQVIVGTLTDPVSHRRLLMAAPKAEVDTPDMGAEITDLSDRKARLLDLYEDGGVDKATYVSRVAGLDRRLDEIKAQLAVTAGHPVLSSIPSDEPGLLDAWDTRGIEWQRLVIDAVFESVKVRPGRAENVADRLAYVLR